MLTVAEVARRLAVGEETVRRLVRQGKLSPIRIGRTCRISEARYEEFATPPPPHPAVNRRETAQRAEIREWLRKA
ncbi:helix-turn-helix domain-containing protein [Sinomonas gamaensis]|uniref:helix-turn-helix domain-containing protein n=1 Tax=Sinomonas gamaensis TaxID=2565624 RepID=UPI001108364D|nr:helix-turn-helix domain-containing protein [Sinomonas gamaensis]